MPLGGKGRRIRPPCFVELAELKELARLACAFERAALPIFHMEIGGTKLMATQLDLFMGSPIFYFAKTQEFKNYLGYRNSTGLEEVIFSDTTTNPTFLYAPIISVKKLPTVFTKRFTMATKTEVEKFLSIEVSDLASLVKVGSYKVLFEEPPLPLFTFSSNGQWILGAFTRIDEYEESSIFFYTVLDNPPSHNFIKYSTLKVPEISFTNRIDEHGYIFIKVVKLISPHPLVAL